MPDPFGVVIRSLIDPRQSVHPSFALDLEPWLATDAGGVSEAPSGRVAAQLAAAFLVGLAGPDHPSFPAARAILERPPADAPDDLVALFAEGSRSVPSEIQDRIADDPSFERTLETAAARLSDPAIADPAIAEAVWSILFPEALGLQADIDTAVDDLRRRRTVTVESPSGSPISDPAREVLFTSNVLLGLPLEGVSDRAALDPTIAAAVAAAEASSQRYWYDHPIPIGVAPQANELLHGLRGLDAAIGAEPRPTGLAGGRVPRVTCLLSVSVTHPPLREIARRYVETELARVDALEHVDVVVVSESDVRRLVDDVLAPAMARWLPDAGATVDGSATFDVLGVDGEYGRHYSFLKAVAAIWHVVVDPAVRATFKIDLDQVFPQSVLLAETGRTALQHLASPLWGASGRDARGRAIDLGMIAGALVNARDIGTGLFTPDVPIPVGPGRPSDLAFFSVLPQAISTRAEMTERYDSPTPDGVRTALERIHVTGGTNGIRVDALRRHRPFTPSFIGRAEDQAYVLSVQGRPGPRLAYAHAASLIMRHDKEAYAGAAIEAAEVGKLVGDDVRILIFSAYAAAIAVESRQAAAPTPAGTSVAEIKALMDPFTGGFISRLPVTTVLIRFALRVIEAYAAGRPDRGEGYAIIGSRRLRETLRLTADHGAFLAGIAAERAQWESLYDTLDALEAAIATGDPDALAFQRRARDLIDGWRVRAPAVDA